NFCSLNYDVTFPMFAKVDVNGDAAHPLWKWLKQEKSGLLGISAIKWNFSKFLVGRDGRVLKRYAPTDTPESLADNIRAALA
ncbi:MAG TPA: glutathione peroxidase, partial [Telluria sp.]